MLTFNIDLYCLKPYYRPDYSIHVNEYHRKNYYFHTQCHHWDSKPGQFLALWPLFFIPHRNNFALGAVFLSCLVSLLQKPPLPGLEFRTLLEFWPSNIFLFLRHNPAKYGVNGLSILELQVIIHMQTSRYGPIFLRNPQSSMMAQRSVWGCQIRTAWRRSG
jgi:hypothetical protein